MGNTFMYLSKKYDRQITSFTGEYEFLSPDYQAPFIYFGVKYNSITDAYNSLRERDIDVVLMRRLVYYRFYANEEDKKKLFTLEKFYIARQVNNHDCFWNNCQCIDCLMVNENMYGKILMDTRDRLIWEDKMARRRPNQHINKWSSRYF